MELLIAALGPVVFWLSCAGFTLAISATKNRNQIGWLVLGLVFGPLALISVGLMPENQRPGNAPTPSTHVRCPDCREIVLREARICRYCRCRLAPEHDVED